MIASGGSDSQLKLWTSNGMMVSSCSNGEPITAIKSYKDELGGTYLKYVCFHYFKLRKHLILIFTRSSNSFGWARFRDNTYSVLSQFKTINVN